MLANEEMGSLYLTLNNSKCDKGQGDYQDQIKNVQGRRVQVIKCEFCAEGNGEGSSIFEMS